MVAFDQVYQSSWARNQYLRVAAELILLNVLLLPSVQTSCVQARPLREFLKLLIYLESQFPGGRQNETQRIVSSPLLLGFYVDQSGQQERQRLSGASLSDSNKIMTCEGDRPPLGLDRRGALEASLMDLLDDRAWKAWRVLELHDGIRDLRMAGADEYVIPLTVLPNLLRVFRVLRLLKI